MRQATYAINATRALGTPSTREAELKCRARLLLARLGRRLHDDNVLLCDLAILVEEERVGRVVVPRARAAPHEEDHARLAFGGLLDADRGRGEPRQVGEIRKEAGEALLDALEPLELDQLVRHLVVDLDRRLLGVVEQDLVDVLGAERGEVVVP